MGARFWTERFFIVLLGAFAILTIVQMLKGHQAADALTHGVVWGVITAIVFTAARIFQSRRGQHCAVCKDTPEMYRHEVESGREAK